VQELAGAEAASRLVVVKGDIRSADDLNRAFNRPDGPKKMAAIASFPELGPKVNPMRDDNHVVQRVRSLLGIGSTQPFVPRRVEVRVCRTAGA
jgi:hypothetical protein